MKHFLSRLPKKLVASIAVSLVAVFSAVAIVHADAGPTRPLKVYNGPGTPGFNYVTFNSFTNVPNIGNEMNFYNGQYPGSSVYTNPLSDIHNGDVLNMEVYVHNDADPSLNNAPGQPGIARNTTVRVALPDPSQIAQKETSTAYISADNATPKTVYDSIDFSTQNNSNFSLAYVPGSAHIRGNYINAPLSDSLVTSGVKVGTDQLDGNVKACFEQEVLVTFQIKVNMPEYTIQKQVRFNGQNSSNWVSSVDTKPGDELQWLVTFKNTGNTPLTNVAIVDNVPAGLTIVPGSVKLINGAFPNGYVFPANAIQNNGRQINVEIGTYNPGILAYVIYNTTVDKPAANVCNTLTLVNKAFATPQGLGSIWNTAQAVENTGNTCTTTPPPTTPPSTTTPVQTQTVAQATQLVNTGPGSVIGIFAGITVLGAVAHRLFISKWLARR